LHDRIAKINSEQATLASENQVLLQYIHNLIQQSASNTSKRINVGKGASTDGLQKSLGGPGGGVVGVAKKH
jgi:hypothetical protein